MIQQPPVWTKGSNASASFTSNAEFADFLYVMVDGEVVDESNYDAKEGSTIITFKAKFLESLAKGKHPVEIVSTTGIAHGMIEIEGPAAKPGTEETQPTGTEETKPSESDAVPRTGTNSGYYPWLALILLSAGGLLLVLRRKRMFGKK
ncbi:MAG: LPXTG cell wall anchor domain-containing protein [Bacillota bacterium]|nr:LPXTG cell wall anchor domain-containing protein [Bacillota bacterium]